MAGGQDVDVQVLDGVSTTWGESLRWDDRRARLWFVDCAARTLCWLDDGVPPVGSMPLPGTPTGLVLTDGDELVVCLDDGLHVIDPDAEISELFAPYPPSLGGRANDAVADGAGNLVTGTLNLAPGPGSLWHLGVDGPWRKLADDTGNTNGPNVIGSTLVVADTVAQAVYAFDYDGASATVGERRVLSDHAELDGAPDGATVDAAGAVWSCVLRRGALARVDLAGHREVVDLPVTNPSDVAFAGADLGRAYVTTIGVDLGAGTTELDGKVLVVDLGAGVSGRLEPRFALHGDGHAA